MLSIGCRISSSSGLYMPGGCMAAVHGAVPLGPAVAISSTELLADEGTPRESDGISKRRKGKLADVA